MVDNKTDMKCEICNSPVMILQEKNGLYYECSYCGNRPEELDANELLDLIHEDHE